MLGRAIISELHKYKHSLLIFWHLVLPILGILVLVGYFFHRNIQLVTKASTFGLLFAAAMPIGIASMIAVSVDCEEDNHFQRLLCNPKRILALYSKLITLFILGCVTIGISIVLAQFVLFRQFDIRAMFVYGCIFVFTNMIFYALHLFINLRFGKTTSILVAFSGAVLGSLLLTVLGDKIWQWIPYSINARLCNMCSVLLYGNPETDLQVMYISEISKAIPTTLIWIVALNIFLIIWFRNWEGRNVTE